MNALLKDKSQNGDEHDWSNRPASMYNYIFQNTQVLII